MSVRRPLVVAAVVAAGCGMTSPGVVDRFSGTWKLADGRKIPIRQVSGAEGIAALRALGGKPCSKPAIYFRSTYFGGVARMAGCSTGDGRRMTGRFDDNGIRGSLTQRITSATTLVAVVHGDGHAPFSLVAKRVSSG